ENVPPRKFPCGGPPVRRIGGAGDLRNQAKDVVTQKFTRRRVRNSLEIVTGATLRRRIPPQSSLIAPQSSELRQPVRGWAASGGDSRGLLDETEGAVPGLPALLRRLRAQPH